MAKELTKAEQNALAVSYDVNGVHVDLDLDFAKRYLVRGQADKVSDQELVFFLNTCKAQKWNPLVGGEVYCIKFGNDPAQIVVGKGAYLRRAFEHPDYLCKEDGIVVQRGNDIIKKEGCCMYPGEALVGGWCRVHYRRTGIERTAYKEVAFAEYNKGQANWKSKPATMINKVAISQCVREAFPREYEGTYSEEEMVASGAIPADYEIIDTPTEEKAGTVDGIISKHQRQELFKMAQDIFGADTGNMVLKNIMGEEGIESTQTMKQSEYEKVVDKLEELATQKREMEDADAEPVEVVPDEE